MRNPIILAGIGASAMFVGIIGSNLLISQQIKDVQDEIRETKGEISELKQEVKVLKQKARAIELYTSKERLNVSQKEFHCLAKNIFHEAGIESKAGKIAVAQITLNRLKSGRWGSNICDVVYAKAQFSWTLDRKLRWSQPKGKLWDDSVEVAEEFVHKGRRVKGLEDSGFYHTHYVNPNWAKAKKIVHQIGQHIFYRGLDA